MMAICRQVSRFLSYAVQVPGVFTSVDIWDCFRSSIMHTSFTSKLLLKMGSVYIIGLLRVFILLESTSENINLSLYFLTEHHAMKAYWGSGCIAPRSL
jgi:hypothetical protein